MTGSPCSPSSRIPLPSRVADDVDWTVEGTHPLAGHYHDKAQFIEATFARLAAEAVPGGVKLEVTHLYVDGDATIAELHSTSKTKEGTDFANDLGVPL
jgi:ketosteroid isomerase-like protein